MSQIFKAAAIIGISFGINKILALLRQYLIVKQFGFSPEIDAFNVANNMPDLLFSLFSGGALAMAFIPVFSEYLDKNDRNLSWRLFSKVTTLLFVVTALASIVIAVFAPFLVSSQLGIAPGFNTSQQRLVVELLRINLIATLIFSISGLVTGSLHAHKHFFLPAIAPIFYNLGIIVGIVILAPIFGIYGLVYGVILGALLHLFIQIPAMLHYQFRFSFSFDLKDEAVKKILRLMGPRILTVFLIQITFLLRDNFASRLETGSVTTLTYGYFIMQVPETLIGSSLAIALLPTLSTFVSQNRQKEFAAMLTTAIRVLLAASLLPTILVFITLTPLINFLFDFPPSQTKLLTWTTEAFMIGLLAHTLLEVFVRAFYARQNATKPLLATFIRTLVFVILGVFLYKSTGVVGIALIDSAAVIVEAVILFIMLIPFVYQKGEIVLTLTRALVGSIVGLAVIWAILSFVHIPVLMQLSIGLLLATSVYLVFVLKEVKLLVKL